VLVKGLQRMIVESQQKRRSVGIMRSNVIMAQRL
jgi:hypothetical protein